MKCNPRCTRIGNGEEKLRLLPKLMGGGGGMLFAQNSKGIHYFVFRCSFYENPYGLCNKGAFDKAGRKSLYETDLTKV
jgi:hypothetical protein